MNPLLMVWKLHEVAVKQFIYFYNEILMVLESSRSYREAMVDCLDSQGMFVNTFINFSNEILMF